MSDTVRIRKPTRYMGIGCLVAGACFLFDPYFAIFDLLPDPVGYLLIAVGLYRLSDLNDRLREVSRAAMRMVLLGIARYVCLFLTFGLVSYTERPVFMLLVAFVLGVLDLILVIPLWRNFGGGLLYLGSRTSATVLFDRHRRHGRPPHLRNRCERYVGFTLFYFMMRQAFAILPELTVLTHERGGADGSGQSLYNYVGFFRLLGITLSLILGIVWLCKTIHFVYKLKSDKPFFEALHFQYATEVAPRHDRFARRAVKASLVSLSAAAVLSLDVFMEGVSVLPDFLAAGAMLLSVILLRRYIGGRGKWLPALVISGLYAISSAATWVMQLTYLSFEDLKVLNNIVDKPLLLERSATVTQVHLVNSALFVAAFVLILRLLYVLARQHTGLRALHEGSTYAADRNQAIHNRIRRKLIGVGTLATLSAISALVLWGVIPRLEAIDLPFRPERNEAFTIMVYDFLREAYWIIDLILGGGLVALTVHAGNEIFEQMDYSDLMN